MRVAAVQLNSTPDPTRNLAKARELFDEAVQTGADLVAFPEFFLLLSDSSKDYKTHTRQSLAMWVETLQEWAAESGVWMLAGSLPFPATPPKVFNRSLLIDADGKIRASYDKIHLFDVTVQGDQTYKESRHMVPGKKVVTPKTPWGRIGMTICYDLRFPELFRKHSAAGAKVIFIPSAFTEKTGQAHWDALTRASAIENQCYVVCPAQTGSPYPGRETYGHTRIIDPWGRVIAERPKGDGVVWADLDFEKLDTIRRDLPALKHRRLK